MASRGKKVGEGEKLDAKTINKVGVWGRRERRGAGQSKTDLTDQCLQDWG